ncbi:MAG: LOG family protein [Gammaproteobacteria bacterium]|nr:LOG family protein [Gammaproteobacteria bacterium]
MTDESHDIATFSARITPEGNMDILSQKEVELLRNTSIGGLHEVFRACSLAVLNSGGHGDNARLLHEKYKDFDIQVIEQERGIKLEVHKAPVSAFIDGEIITSIKDQLFCVLRDIIYVHNEINSNSQFDLESGENITNAIFHILRNAQVFYPGGVMPNLVVCWGGHAIQYDEYEYTKEIGYQLGLRELNIITGCGPGAMKGPMKGATIGQFKQRKYDGRYIGITEPGIIAAESPNPIVNELIIMPDIEKRLEAFVRAGHGIIIFPGGPGTMEELLYILGILLHPKNEEIPFTVILTGTRDNKAYFESIHNFIGLTLGYKAQQNYKIIIDDPAMVARTMKKGLKDVELYRRKTSDAFYYNWMLHIDQEFQRPFNPTHENMSKLQLDKNQETHHLAANLRRAFSGIVAGNVKEDGIKAIEEHGKFQLSGDKQIMQAMDELLQMYVEQHRMKLAVDEYIPCYEIIE